jgi:hypothetical protein
MRTVSLKIVIGTVALVFATSASGSECGAQTVPARSAKASEPAPRDEVAKAGHKHDAWYSNATPSADCHGKKCGVCKACFARPYHSCSFLYGYQDYVYRRGPVIDLGSVSLQPGFRGYGVFGSFGYGHGLRPTSAIDRSTNAHAWHLP